MQPAVKKILHATFILPWTSGLIKERRNGDFSLHDGSISGIVLLTTIVILSNEIMFFFPLTNSTVVVIVILNIATLSLGVCFVMTTLNGNRIVRRNYKHTDKLKLIFMWLFCVANIIFQGLKFAINFQCESYSDIKELLTYYISTWLFQIFQAVFIQYFSRVRFQRNLGLYFCLLVLIVANISLWTHRSLFNYIEDEMALNLTDVNIVMCNNDTALLVTVRRLEPFFNPVLLEYCLICAICLSEMWPKQAIHYNSEIQSPCSEETEESQWLLRAHTDTASSNKWNRKSVCVFLIGALYTFSFIITEILFIHIQELQHYLNVLFTYYTFGNFIRIPLIIKCFHALSGQLRPNHSSKKVVCIKHIIILISSMATCGYVIVECIEKENLYGYIDKIRLIINAVIRVFATVMQTSFILQMKHYKKAETLHSIFSITNTFLFMSWVNLSMWFSYTFVTGQYTTKTFDRISISMWLKIKHFWFPLVIFYHFECFISFYHFFRK